MSSEADVERSRISVCSKLMGTWKRTGKWGAFPQWDFPTAQHLGSQWGQHCRLCSLPLRSSVSNEQMVQRGGKSGLQESTELKAKPPSAESNVAYFSIKWKIEILGQKIEYAFRAVPTYVNCLVPSRWRTHLSLHSWGLPHLICCLSVHWSCSSVLSRGCSLLNEQPCLSLNFLLFTLLHTEGESFRISSCWGFSMT